jgi:hypothetical protein
VTVTTTTVGRRNTANGRRAEAMRHPNGNRN